MRLHFVWIGKTRDRRCAALVEDYLTRIKHFAQYEVTEIRDQKSGDEKQLIEAEGARIAAALERDDFVLLLDEGGAEMSSKELALMIDQCQIRSVRRLGIVVGGFAGLSDEVRGKADARLSLSRLTMTHELARVVLLEQIYRAFTLIAGLPYHR
jgi:23S rRNA (pseudouridine1915-N3)-methyltransferase